MMRFSLRGVVLWLLLVTACCVPALVGDMQPSVVAPAPVRVRMLFAGDLMQHMPQVEAARRNEGFDYDAMLRYVRPRFEAADLTVINLETTLTRSDHYTGYPRFRSPVALAGALQRAGVDVAVLANNHCCDGGAEGIRTTFDELAACKIRRTGVFADSLDRVATHPLLITQRGVHFALLNYTYATNGLPIPAGFEVSVIDTMRMISDLAAADRAGADCTVVCIHWGEEYERQERAEQRNLAALLRRHGADVVIGSHPHVVQPTQSDSTFVVVYSLGNFVSNQRQRYSDGGLLAQVDVVKHPDGRMSYALETIPVWVALPGYRVLPPEVADTMSLPASYALFREDTHRLLGTAL